MKKLFLTMTVTFVIAISFTACTEDVINPDDSNTIIVGTDDEEDESNPPKLTN